MRSMKNIGAEIPEDSFKAGLAGRYLIIPFEYNKGEFCTLFIPWDFLEGGPGPFNLSPDNLFGVNMKMVLDKIRSEAKLEG